MAARNALAETLDNMLDFYGVQLQSHAALVIASFAGFFIAIQIWTAVRPPSIWFLLALPIVMSLSVVGAVYCNGTNLNAELLRSGLAVLVTYYCGVSEFAKESWTGCP